MGKRLGLFRAVYLVCLCCMGSFTFAYDTGIIGGLLTLKSFQRDFRYSKARQTSVNSNAVSVLQGGAFFGCFLIWPVTARIGRRLSLVLSSIVFCAGTIVQVINTHSLAAFFVGRVVSGVGVGAATVLVPMYSAEMAPKDIRGKLGACFQLFFATGVMVAYWVDYGVSKGVSSDSSAQWQIPVGLQLVPAGVLFLGMFAVKESARWLAKMGRNEEALESLRWIRGGEDTPELRIEFNEIIAGVEEEARVLEGFSLKELLLPANRYRVFIAITIQLCAQLSGNTSLAYYASEIFSEVGAGDSSMLVTGFFGVVKVVGVLTFQLFVLDRIGRRKPFMVGAGAMGCFMLIIACIIATHPPAASAKHASASGIAAIIMTYAEAFSFNMSWGPLPWLYLGEIFSNRTREAGIAIGAASQWLFNFMMSQITPHALNNIGWRTFLMFAIFNFAIIVYSYLFLKETQGRSLEEMESLFSTTKSVDSDAYAVDNEEQFSRAGGSTAK